MRGYRTGRGGVTGAWLIVTVREWMRPGRQEKIWAELEKTICGTFGGTGRYYLRQAVYGAQNGSRGFVHYVPGKPTHVWVMVEVSP